MQTAIVPPNSQELLAPLLASLPAASISPEPPTALLPLLSPILRQRVQLLSASSQDPWLSLLCYDSTNTSRLEQAVRSEGLEPHPVSGEVEVDWEYDVAIRYKRIDEETLQAQVSLREFGLNIKLVWCVGDEIGGGDGWRIGEVSVLDGSDTSWGGKTIPEAEDTFKARHLQTTIHLDTHHNTNGTSLLTPEDDGDDDDYWAQYDRTPSRTPAKHSPAPPAQENDLRAHADEDSYYAQYAGVQAAMDSHDPDEAQQNGDVETSLGRDEITTELQQHLSSHPELNPSHLAWSQPHDEAPTYTEEILHPRPASSTGSSGSDTVAKLEKRAAASHQSEVGIKQHISTSMKSLYRLARVSGIDRDEFERLVRTELDCLGLMDEDD
ncbi:hypothetical protein B0J14DRAFT_103080 [Halenospora varia]|nr:hypothetical protein B0J14DRAFT_103080 [Halenospora varia]